MPVFTSKTSTDPGPFDALHPASERGSERVNVVNGVGGLDPSAVGGAGLQQSEHSAPRAADTESELDNLYRFQEIPVSAEMRRELLGAKLPLASVDQLADTQPPHKSSLSAPLGPGLVDRHAPTVPALRSPRRASEPNHDPKLDSANADLPPVDGDSYSSTAPTLLSVRRRRLRNQRLVMAALVAMMLAILSGVAWRRSTRPHVQETHLDRGATAKIAGNRPAGANLPQHPDTRADSHADSQADKHAGGLNGAAALPTSVELADRGQDLQGAQRTSSDSQSAQLGLPATDATSSSPLAADPSVSGHSPSPAPSPNSRSPHEASTSPSTLSGSKGRAEPQDAVEANKTTAGTKAAPKGQAGPSRTKGFDPEELIF